MHPVIAPFPLAPGPAGRVGTTPLCPFCVLSREREVDPSGSQVSAGGSKESLRPPPEGRLGNDLPPVGGGAGKAHSPAPTPHAATHPPPAFRRLVRGVGPLQGSQPQPPRPALRAHPPGAIHSHTPPMGSDWVGGWPGVGSRAPRRARPYRPPCARKKQGGGGRSFEAPTLRPPRPRGRPPARSWHGPTPSRPCLCRARAALRVPAGLARAT